MNNQDESNYGDGTGEPNAGDPPVGGGGGITNVGDPPAGGGGGATQDLPGDGNQESQSSPEYPPPGHPDAQP